MLVLRTTVSISLVAAAVALFSFQHSARPAELPTPAISEQWRPSLSNVTSIDKAMPIVRGYIERQTGSRDERIVRGIDAFVRDRFLHGVSNTSARDDWLLSMLGNVPKYGVDVPIMPNSILRHQQAMCSQQAIVFMELLKRFGIEYASVRFGWPNTDPLGLGHFALTAKVDGKWRYYDTDLEAAAAPLVRDIQNGSAISRTYPVDRWWVPKMKYAAAHGGIIVDSFNRDPGPRGLLLQKTTRLISAATPLALLVLAILLWLGPVRGRRNRSSRFTFLSSLDFAGEAHCKNRASYHPLGVDEIPGAR